MEITGNNKNILFSFVLGSEIRQFMYSGIISKLLDNEHRVFISSRLYNNEIAETLDKRVSFLPFYRYKLPKIYAFVQSVNDEVAQSKKWKYLDDKSTVAKPKFKTVRVFLHKFFSYRLTFWLSIIVEQLLQIIFRFRNLENDLKTNKIDIIIVNVPKVNYPLLFAAKRLKIPVKLIYQTNKDVFAQSRLDYRFSAYGVWNQYMYQELLKQNRHVKSKSVEIVGCTHFNYLDDNKQTESRSDFFKTYSVNPEFKTITYIAAAPFVVENEFLYVRFLEEILKNLQVKYRIFIRVNPMDDSGVWLNYESDSVTVLSTNWVWNKKEAFNFPRFSDLSLFSSLLKNSDFIIGLPSTVAVESAITRTPNINIVFDLDGVKLIYGHCLSMWEAPFNENIRKYMPVIPCFNSGKLSEIISELISRPWNPSSQEIFLKNELTFSSREIFNKTYNFIVK